jgi:tetratricopeptide (TPR) repeat protein
MKLKIRYIVLILISSLIFIEGLAQETNTEKFNQGVTYFSSGNYKDALQVWTDLYNTGSRSANLNYNIANAYFKLNDIPDAILFYERAYLLNPSDENINYNLQIARTLIVDRFQEIPELFFIKWYNLISLFQSTNTWAKLSITFFIFCLILFSLYIYSSRYRHKVSGFWLGMFFFILAASSFTFSERNNKLVYESHKAIISSPQISGKSSPDDSGTDLFVLHEGTKVSIEDEIGGWYEIRLSDGNKGWVPLNSLSII